MEGDEERTSLLDEPTDPGHGDEAVGELSQGLREPGLHVLRLLPLHAKSTLGEPVEISRRRTPRLLKQYFMMPMGNERYSLIDPEGPIELKGEWPQQDHSVCVAVVSFVGGFVSLAIVEVATGGVGNVAAYFVGGAGALFGGIAGHVFCPGPPQPSAPSPPIGSVIRDAFDLPWLGPDPGCGCGHGCDCGCVDAPSGPGAGGGV